jgi:hypothetical protein
MQKRTPDMRTLMLLIATIPACFAQVDKHAPLTSKAAQVAEPSVAKTPAKKGAMAQLKPGIVSGRVFLITGGGDIKPARMAKLYLLYLTGELAGRDPGDPAATVFGKVGLKVLARMYQKEEEEGYNWSDSYLCRQQLGVSRAALIETVEWGKKQSITNQFQFADADEDGNFKITVEHPGTVERPSTYCLLVFGRAGFNDAFWQSFITVSPGVETTVKLSSPDKACLVN